MKEGYFSEIKSELQLGATQKGHPLNYCTLGTVGLENLARLRTVVLRQVTDDLTLAFYTDRRSKKVLHIKENPKASLLFYHPDKLLQIKVEGIASINRDLKTINTHWKALLSKSKKEYSTTRAPGIPIQSADAVEYLKNDNHFCLVEIAPFKIEYLKLKQPTHIRRRFSMEDGQWKKEFLVP